MEHERAKEVARAYRSTAKAVHEAIDRGVDESDIDDFFHARNLAVISLESNGMQRQVKPTVAQVAGMYHLSGGNVDVLLELAEEVRLHTQITLEGLFDTGELNAAWLEHTATRDIGSEVSILMSQYLAERFDEELDRAAGQMVQSHQSSNIDAARETVHASYGLSRHIERTPNQTTRLKRQLTTTAFVDVHRDTGGFPRDFDLTAASRLIDTDIEAARMLQNRFLLSGMSFRVAAELLLDPELPFARRQNGEYAPSSLGVTDDFEQAIALDMEGRLSNYFGVMVPAVISSEISLANLRRQLDVGDEHSHTVHEDELVATIKRRFLAMHSSLRDYTINDESLWDGFYNRGTDEATDSLRQATGRVAQRFERYATYLLYRSAGRSGIANAIAYYAQRYPGSDYERVCKSLGIAVDLVPDTDFPEHRDLTDGEDFVIAKPLREDIEERWNAVREDQKKRQAAAETFRNALSGQRDQDLSND